jgi:hypothetical protein
VNRGLVVDMNEVVLFPVDIPARERHFPDFASIRMFTRNK